MINWLLSHITHSGARKAAAMLCVVAGMSINANAQSLPWKKNFGGSGDDYYNSVTAVSDGFVAVGRSIATSFNNSDWAGVTGRGGGEDAIIVKYDNSGNVVWKKNFGGDGNDDFRSVTAVSDGVVAVGRSTAASFGTGDWIGVTGRGGAEDAIVVKYDNNGNVVWKKNFGGSAQEDFGSVTAVSDGFVATGVSYVAAFGTGDWAGVSAKGSLQDLIVVKYNNNGDVVWKKNFGGGSGYVGLYSVTPASDNSGVVVVGFAGSFGNGDWSGVAGKGGYDAIIVKYDNSGNVVWNKNFGGSGDDSYSSVTAVSDGVVAVGRSTSTSFVNGDLVGLTGKGGDDAIIVKYDNSGNVMWKNNFGGSGNDYYNSVTAVSDGVVAVGYSATASFGNGDLAGVTGKGGNDAIIVKYDNNGNVVWKKNFGGSGNDEYKFVTAVSDGVVAVGYSASFGNSDWAGVTGKGGNDAIIVKYFTPNMSGVTFQNKIVSYNGTPQSLSVGGLPAGISASYTNNGQKDAGTHPVTATFAVDYPDYTIITSQPGPMSATLTINPAPLTISSATIPQKTYDGNTDATVSSIDFSGLQNSETLASPTDYTFTAVYNTKDAGSDKMVTITPTLTTSAKANNYAFSNNYSFNTQPDQTINKATLTVSADNKTATYGENPPTYSYAIAASGFISGESESVVSGLPALSSAYQQGSNVGSYDIEIAVGTLSAANYDFAGFGNGTLTVGALNLANANIDAISNAVYKGSEHEPTPAATFNSYALNCHIFSHDNNINAGTAEVTITASNTNCTGSKKAYFTIEPAEIEITSATVDPRIYDGTTKATAYGIVFDNLPNNETLNLGTDYTFTAEYDNKDVGASKTVTITPTLTNTNYEFTSSSYSFSGKTITQMPIVVTAEKNQSKIYDDANPVYKYTVNPSLFAGDDFTGGLGRNAGEDVGDYAINLGTLNNNNYDIDFVSADFEITQKPITDLTITIPSVTYTGLAQEPNLTITTNDYDVVYTDNKDAGTATATVNGKGNYSGTKIVNFTINPASLTILSATVDPKIYDGNTEATVVDIGFTGPQNNETLNLGADYTFTAEYDSKDVGNNRTVTITPALTNTNYEFTNSFYSFSGKTITQMPIVVTAEKDQAKVYGETNPVYKYTVNPALFAGDDFTGGLGRNAGEDIGDYAINLGTLDNSNYDITFIPADFEIKQMPITITVDPNQSKIYGDADPAYTYTVSSALSFTGALEREQGNNVGLYKINIGTLDIGSNYDIDFVPADFEITQLPITVTVDANQTKVYGEADPAYTYTTDISLIAGDELSGTLERKEGEDVGDYAINQGTLGNSNYKITFASEDFRITQKPITVTVNANQSKIYGDAEPVYKYTVSPSLVAGDNLSGELEREPGEDAGDYLISQGTLAASGNYAMSFAGGTFQIARKAITADMFTFETRIYSGGMLKPRPMAASVTFDIGTYSNNINAGTAFVIVDGTGNYFGTQTLEFTIEPRELTITGFSISKIHDGTQNVKNLGPLEFAGLEIGETAEVDASGVVAKYASKDLGEQDIIFTGTFAMAGGNAKSSNYAITQPVGITGKILNPPDSVIVTIKTKDGEEAFFEKHEELSTKKKTYYLIEPKYCGVEEAKVRVGEEDVETILLSKDGGFKTYTYNENKDTVVIASPLPFPSVIVRRWHLLAVNNNPLTNGGYKFSGTSWTKNGNTYTTDYLFFDPRGATLSDVFSVNLITTEGAKINTCEDSLNEALRDISKKDPEYQKQVLGINGKKAAAGSTIYTPKGERSNGDAPGVYIITE